MGNRARLNLDISVFHNPAIPRVRIHPATIFGSIPPSRPNQNIYLDPAWLKSQFPGNVCSVRFSVFHSVQSCTPSVKVNKSLSYRNIFIPQPAISSLVIPYPAFIFTLIPYPAKSVLDPQGLGEDERVNLSYRPSS